MGILALRHLVVRVTERDAYISWSMCRLRPFDEWLFLAHHHSRKYFHDPGNVMGPLLPYGLRQT